MKPIPSLKWLIRTAPSCMCYDRCHPGMAWSLLQILVTGISEQLECCMIVLLVMQLQCTLVMCVPGRAPKWIGRRLITFNLLAIEMQQITAFQHESFALRLREKRETLSVWKENICSRKGKVCREENGSDSKRNSKPEKETPPGQVEKIDLKNKCYPERETKTTSQKPGSFACSKR